MDLLATLNGQRQHVQEIAEGLTEADLRRPVLPSAWTILGLINHLALDVERFWFCAVVGGQRDVIGELAATTDAWHVEPDVPARRVLDRYRQQSHLADAVITTTAQNAPPAWWPPGQFGDWRLRTHREVLLHVITETACHAGHLDAARELIDGRQWVVLP